MKLKRIKINFDWTLVIVPAILAVCGIATIYSISSISGKTHLVTDQIEYLGIATILYISALLFDYRRLKGYVWYLLGLGLVLLIVVDFFGQTTFGSTRWINFGFAQFQPSEVMKLIAIIFSAYFLSKITEKKWLKLLTYIVLMIIPIYLILKEPDLGTALTVGVVIISALVAAGVNKKYLIIGAIIVIAVSPFVYANLKPYQKQRVTAFVNPASDPQGSGYNVSQSKIAVGSGGLYGKGFSGATQSQLQFLPVAHIDFIFSGFAEATGFIGSALLVLSYAILIWRLFIISNQARDDFGRIIVFTTGTMIFFQAFVNIGMNIGLMPVTGIPLPFVSYGGTSFLVNGVLFGIVQSIYIRRNILKFD